MMLIIGCKQSELCACVYLKLQKSVASPLTFPPSSLSSLRRGGIFARRLITSSSCCQKNRGRPPLQDSFSSSRNVAVDDEDPGVNVIAKAGKNDFARAHTLILRANNNRARAEKEATATGPSLVGCAMREAAAAVGLGRSVLCSVSPTSILMICQPGNHVRVCYMPLPLKPGACVHF